LTLSAIRIVKVSRADDKPLRALSRLITIVKFASDAALNQFIFIERIRMQFLERHFIHKLKMAFDSLLARFKCPLNGPKSERFELGRIGHPSYRLVHWERLYVCCSLLVDHCEL
jgi:hypothetical protein